MLGKLLALTSAMVSLVGTAALRTGAEEALTVSKCYQLVWRLHHCVRPLNAELDGAKSDRTPSCLSLPTANRLRMLC